MSTSLRPPSGQAELLSHPPASAPGSSAAAASAPSALGTPAPAGWGQVVRRGEIFWALALVGLVLAFRKPDALWHPQFWAEDGAVFFRQNLELGLRAVVVPYSGYLHLLPRLVAWTTGFAPLAWQPAGYVWLTWLAALVTAAKVFSPRVRLPAKPWLALATVGATHTGEALLNPTNLQWITAPFLLLLLVQDPPRNAWERGRDVLACLLLGLTGPLLLVFSPLFAWRVARDFRRAPSGRGRLAQAGLTLAAVVVPAAVEAWFLFGGRAPGGSWHHHPAQEWLYVLAWKPLTGLWCGQQLAELLSPEAAGVLAAFLVLVLLWRAARPGGSGQTAFGVVATLLAAGLLSEAATLHRLLPMPEALTTLGYGGAERYYVPVRLALLWSLLLVWSQAPPGGWWRRGLAGALALCALALAADFQSPPQENLRWREQVRNVRAGRTDVFAVPPGWTFRVAGRGLSPRARYAGVFEHLPPLAVDSAVAVGRFEADGRPFELTHVPGAVTFAVPAGARQASGEFAFDPQAWRVGHPAGAAFRVEYRPSPDSDRGAAVLFERVLRPSDAPADRPAQTFRVELPAGARRGGQLVLRTAPLPAANGDWGWTGWRGVEIR